MLEKPNIQDHLLIHSLQEGYGKKIQSLSFLPLGADTQTAVYKASTYDHTHYFVKLRSGRSHLASVAVPNFLADQGFKHFIPTLKTKSGALHHQINSAWTMSLHPFIEGHHGYAKQLTPEQWMSFGLALKSLHTVNLKKSIADTIPTEAFSANWHNELIDLLGQIEPETFSDPISLELVVLFKQKKKIIFKLIETCEKLIPQLLNERPKFVLCHADIHCWNLLIDESSGALYIVDWDTLIFAPKERDLMFIGAGLADSNYTATQEENMFYKGYGTTLIHSDAMTYYRCMRIIEDLVIYCKQILLSTVGEEDRKQSLHYVQSNFRPNGAIAMAIGPVHLTQ